MHKQRPTCSSGVPALILIIEDDIYVFSLIVVVVNVTVSTTAHASRDNSVL